MDKINFDEITNEIISILENEKSIILATSFNDKVTVRTMSHVNDGTTIYFQTGSTSEKFEQLKNNKNIAFAIRNLQIECIAEICGHPNQNPKFIELYKIKFPNYYNLYTNNEEEILIKAVPVKVKLYKYTDGNPCLDIVDFIKKTAYRK